MSIHPQTIERAREVAGEHHGIGLSCAAGMRENRLEAALATTGTGTLHYKLTAAVIADLRRVAGES